MSSMQNQPPQELIELCDSLYGPVVDPYVLYETVAKKQAQEGSSVRRNVERASNAVGITAGSLGLAGALRDDRLKDGGKVARFLHATGQKMPKVLGRIQNKKVQAALAAGAVGTQVANLGGDALIAGTLGKKPAKQARKSDYALAKRDVLYLVPTQVGKLSGLPPITKITAGYRAAWNPGIKSGPQFKAKAKVGNIHPTTVKAPKPPKPTGPTASTRAGVKAQNEAQAKAAMATKQRAQGADVSQMLSTNSGKVMTGIVGAGTLYAGSKVLPKRGGYEYAPDYAKRDSGDVVFKGQFVDFDDDKKQAFGWASVVKINGVPVVDKQGDYISIDDLETAAYEYVHKSRVGGDMHKRNGDAPHKVSDMIESIVFTDEKCEALNLPPEHPRGWWVGYQIHDPDTWNLVRNKGRTGFSIHGRGIRRDVDEDELMGAR
jgi:Putative phage serine protease XkdF